MRTKLNRAIKAAFGFEGYTFYQGFIYHIMGTPSKLALPCVWLNPVTLSGREGRKEGTITYNVVMYLMDFRERYESEEQKEVIWGTLEEKALAGYHALFNNENVRSAQNLKCEPDESALSNYKELSMKVTFSVVMPYCDGN